MPCYQPTTGVSSPPRTGKSYATEAECLDACREGACCEGATCSVMPQCQCQGTGKTFQGVGTTCSPNPCLYCCPSGSLPSSITFTISGFTTSRGRFLNWNPNRTYSLSSPEIFFGSSGEPGVARSRSCLCYSSYDYSLGYDVYGGAINAATCSSYRVIGSPGWTLKHSIAIGSAGGVAGSDGCVYGDTVSGGKVFIAVWLQDRTENGDDAGLLSVVRATSGMESLSTQLTRSQFLDAVCSGTLSVSGSVQTAFSVFSPSTLCQPSSGSVSFNWTLRSNPLP